MITVGGVRRVRYRIIKQACKNPKIVPKLVQQYNCISCGLCSAFFFVSCKVTCLLAQLVSEQLQRQRMQVDNGNPSVQLLQHAYYNKCPARRGRCLCSDKIFGTRPGLPSKESHSFICISPSSVYVQPTWMETTQMASLCIFKAIKQSCHIHPQHCHLGALIISFITESEKRKLTVRAPCKCMLQDLTAPLVVCVFFFLGGATW